jgi:uncharacterized protein
MYKLNKNGMKNKLFFSTLISIISLSSSLSILGQQKLKIDTLNFQFEDKKYSGLIDYPDNEPPKGIIIFVPGDGPTNINDKSWFAYTYFDSLRTSFKKVGLACVLWDKAGCGKSEGKYDHNQTVQNSAQEILAAIKELKRRNISGASKIGFWGISRGGYICPLVIQQYPAIAFWISVSGTDGNDSFAYLLESYLRLAGRSEPEIKLLIDENNLMEKIFYSGGSYDSYLKSTQNIRKDTTFIKTFNLGWNDSLSYSNDQASYIQSKKIVEFDSLTNLKVFVPDFCSVLNTVHCPTLAIFGEKDHIVDWRKTKALYESTLRKNLGTKYTLKTFKDANHAIFKCKTGAYNENLEKWELADNYFGTMRAWLKENGF